MFGPQPTPFTAPGQLFSVTVPGGWQVFIPDKEPNAVEFRAATLAGHGSLFVRRVKVPENARPRQLALAGLEQRLKKLPSFKLASRRDVTLAGLPATVITGSYAFQGNLQFPRALEEVYVVAGEEAFVFHFECFEPAAGLYGPDLGIFYGSFQPRPVGGTQGPFAVPEGGAEEFKLPDPSDIPF